MNTIRRIEVNFAVPTPITDDQMRAIHEIVGDMCDATETAEMVHWPAGAGSKPLWREPLEPEWDDSVYCITTCARERYETEKFEPRRVQRSRLARALGWLRRMGEAAREDRRLAEEMWQEMHGEGLADGSPAAQAWRAVHPKTRRVK